MRLEKDKLDLLLAKIKQYQTIAIFRHDSPDFDALGSQWGLWNYLKHNFPNKRILSLGTSHVELGYNLFPKDVEVSDDELYSEPFLALVLDTANTQRISDNRFAKGAYIIKIDHHPVAENFENLALVDQSAAAASELLYYILASETFAQYDFNQEAARCFFIGISGDTAGFETTSTTSKTFLAAGNLLKYGFDLQQDVYQKMYNRKIQDFNALKEIMDQSVITTKGVAYYILEADLMKKYDIDSDEARKFLSIFKFYNSIKIYGCFSWDERANNYRVSLRSNEIVINGVGQKHGGGGHKMAAGAKAKNHQEIEQIIAELEALI